jgi:aarF domain-containing kinase
MYFFSVHITIILSFQIQVSALLSDVFSVLSKHKVKMESNFASILLAIFVLEGLARSLDPEMDILEKARPILLGQ